MTKIPLEILTLEDGSYHLLINIVINDNLRGKMVVDTGASKTVIDTALDLPIDENSDIPYTSGIGGQVTVNFTKVAKLALGNFIAEELYLAMIDLASVNEAYEQVSQHRIVGLLGSDLLLKHNAIIDYKKQCLFLEECESDKNK